MLTRTQKLAVAAVTVSPVLAMVVLIGMHVSRQIARVMEDLTPIAVRELERETGRQVSIGRITAGPTGTAIAEDVRISEGPTFGSGTLLSAERVTVRYDLRGIVLGGQGAAAVSSVEVLAPTVLVIRRSNGTLNISDLLRRRPGPRRRPFAGRVFVRNGRVAFRDYMAGARTLPVTTTLHNVDALVDASREPSYGFHVVASGAEGKFDLLRVLGCYNSQDSVVRLDANATTVNASLAAAYAPPLGGVVIENGVLRPNLGISAKHVGDRWVTRVSGVLGVEGLALRLPGVRERVRRVSGRVVLADDQVAVSLSGTFAGSTIGLTGAVSDFANPRLDLALKSPRVQYARALRAVDVLRSVRVVSVSGSGPVSARIIGRVSAPVVAVTATVPGASLQGYRAANVDVAAIYCGGVVALSSLRMNVAGGLVMAAGQITTAGVPAIDISGRAVGVEAGRLRLPTTQRVVGRIDAQFHVTGTTSRPAVSAAAEIRDGSFADIAFYASSVSVSYDQQRLEAAGDLVARVADGVVRFSGSVTPAHIDAAYTAEGVNLALLRSRLGVDGLGGVLFSTGRVSGPITDPEVVGTCELFGGHYREVTTDYARVAFRGTKHWVGVSEGVVRMLPAEIEFTGGISGFQGRRLDFQGEVHARSVRMEQLLDLVKREAPVTGTLTGDFTISGGYLTRRPRGVNPLVDTMAAGTLSLEDGTAFEYPISSASAALSFAGDLVSVQDAAITSDGARATIGGTISVFGGLADLAFDLTGFDVSRLRDRLGQYAVFAGVLSASGSVTGELRSPVVAVSAVVDDMLLNSTRFDRATFTAEYADSLLSTVTAQLGRGEQVYRVEATDVDVTTRCFSGATAAVRNGSAADLWVILTASPYLATPQAEKLREALRGAPRVSSGLIDLRASAGGCLGNPDGSVRLVARNVGFDDKRIESIVVDASAAGGVVTLNEARAVSEDMYVEAAPVEPGVPVYADGLLRVELAAYNVDLERLSPWLRTNTPSGTLTARFDVVGPARQPSVVGSIEVESPGYGGIVFDRLRASRIEVGKDSVRVTDVILAANGHQIVARGSLPWDWATYTIPREKPLAFSAELQREDLSILSTFADAIDPVTTRGPMQAVVDVSGTLADVKLSGVVQVDKGSIGIRGFRNTFNNVDVDLVFDNKRLLVNQLSADSSLGGDLRVVPGSYVNVGNLETSDLNLLVAAKGLTLSEQNVFGYTEDINMQLDVALSVTGSLASPLVAEQPIDSLPGGLTVHDSMLAFAIPERTVQAEARKFAVNPRLDVGVDLGQNVIVRPPKMNMVLTGGGRVGGSLERPDVRLDIGVTKGNLMLGTSVLRVVPGGTVVVTYAPPGEPSLFLRDFEATTSVTATNPFGQRERYAITIHVSGQIDRMNIELSSSPPGLTREQILAALGHVEGLFATEEGTLQKELADVLTAVGTSTLFAPVERLFVEQLGFEQFSLEYSAVSPLAVYLSRRLFEGVYLSYFQALRGGQIGTNKSRYQVELAYRFRRKYHVSFGLDDQQTTTLQVGLQRAF